MINHRNEIDTALDAPYMSVPKGIAWPAPVAKLITEYEKAWDAYDATQIKYLEATAVFDQAEAADTLALISAVAAGEPHPGHTNVAQANDALRYQEEATRQAATKANVLADKIRTAAIEHRDEITTQAVALERQSIAALVTAYEEARASIEAANLAARVIGSRINWITHTTDPEDRYRMHAELPTEMTWPQPYQLAHLAQTTMLDNLELRRTTEQAPTAQ